MQNQDELTPQERELEQALKTLRPVAARIDAEAAVLAARRRTTARRTRVWAAAAAAVLAAIGLWRVTTPRDSVSPDKSVHLASNERAAHDNWESPTEIAYRRALMQSPAAMDALLDENATIIGLPDIEITRAGTATFWNVSFHPSSGDL